MTKEMREQLAIQRDGNGSSCHTMHIQLANYTTKRGGGVSAVFLLLYFLKQHIATEGNERQTPLKRLG